VQAQEIHGQEGERGRGYEDEGELLGQGVVQDGDKQGEQVDQLAAEFRA
jgi:hypothetical protein